MNRTLFSATLLAALLCSAAALAQPDHKDEQRGGPRGHGQPAAGAANRGGQGGQDHGRGGQAPAGRAAARSDHQGRGPSAAPQQAMRRQPSAAPNRAATFQNERRHVERSRPSGAPAPAERHFQSNRETRSSGFAQRGAVNSGARPGRQFVYRGRPHEAIRGPSYSYPSGWGYRRWGIGQSLPFLFLTPSYFFNDYDSYGFGPPPRHYIWVRYGPDLLLVNRRTGRIREVIYGVFY